MPKPAKIALCSVPACARVGRVKRGMCYACYQLWLKRNPELVNPTSFTAVGKICKGCNKDKPLSDYGHTKRNKSGLEARCRDCLNIVQKRWREQNPDKAKEMGARWRARNPNYEQNERYRSPEYKRKAYLERGWSNGLMKRYGITSDKFHAMLELQGGGCAVCDRQDSGEGDRQMHVDHCHRTGVIRGVLCGPCNKGIGLLADDPDRLMAAAAYLLQHTDVLAL